MKPSIKTMLLPALMFAACGQAIAQNDLKILAPAAGVTELDLFTADGTGVFLKSMNADAVSYPIRILEDRNGGFIIQIEGAKYYVGAASGGRGTLGQGRYVCSELLPLGRRSVLV